MEGFQVLGEIVWWRVVSLHFMMSSALFKSHNIPSTISGWVGCSAVQSTAWLSSPSVAKRVWRYCSAASISHVCFYISPPKPSEKNVTIFFWVNSTQTDVWLAQHPLRLSSPLTLWLPIISFICLFISPLLL